jgi:hypothetical protein
LEPQPQDAPTPITVQALVVRKASDDGPNAYALFDREGTPLGAVRQVDTPSQRSFLRRVTNLLDWTSELPTVRLEVTDTGGNMLFMTTLSAETGHLTAAVQDGDGNELGEVVKAKGIRKIHFDLRARGVTLGTVDAEGWSGFDYRIDERGVPVGRITMVGGDTVVGIPTTSDDFLLNLDRPLGEPLQTLVVACAVGMDVSVSSDD